LTSSFRNAQAAREINMRAQSLLLCVGLLAAATWVAPAFAESGAVIFNGRVPADWPAETTAPVMLPLPEVRHGEAEPGRTLGDATALSGELQVEGWDAPRRVTIQCEPPDQVAGTPASGFFLCSLAAEDRGRPVSLRILGVEPAPASSPYRSRLDGPVLSIRSADGGEILSYWHGPPDPDKRLPLTSFIHTLIGLDGELLTAVRPSDHIHHRGVFWAWVRHQRDGQNIGDWWHPRNIEAEPGVLHFSDGPVFSRFAARHDWVYGTRGDGPRVRFVEEHVVCRVFETGEHGRALDVEIALTGQVPGIRFGGTLELGKGYGGFTFRYSNVQEAVVEADGERIDRDLNQVRAAWMDLNGLFPPAPDAAPPRVSRDTGATVAARDHATGRSGAAILVHPHHPDHPPEWIVRGPAAAGRGGSYAVLNVSYPGMEMIDLSLDEPLRLRYRLWIHRGDASRGRVEDHYRAYASDWRWESTKER
jgi:hypothetical protein